MNQAWFDLLKAGALASVRVDRRPAVEWYDEVIYTIPAPPPTRLHPRTYPTSLVGRFIPGLSVLPPGPRETWPTFPMPRYPRPYIEILFEPEFSEAWMTQEAEPAPAHWSVDHGFDGMEHFEVKVGIIA